MVHIQHAIVRFLAIVCLDDIISRVLVVEHNFRNDSRVADKQAARNKTHGVRIGRKHRTDVFGRRAWRKVLRNHSVVAWLGCATSYAESCAAAAAAVSRGARCADGHLLVEVGCAGS
jgi:hypothetical protein